MRLILWIAVVVVLCAHPAPGGRRRLTPLQRRLSSRTVSANFRSVQAEIVIRDASDEDADAISAIGKKAMPAQYVGLVDSAAVAAAVEQTYDPSVVADCIARCRGKADAQFLAAERAGRVIGYLHFDCFGPEAELHRLYIDEDERSGGVGRLLMDALHERIGPDAGYMLLVVEGNDRAVRFYERWVYLWPRWSMGSSITQQGWASSSRRKHHRFRSC